MTVRAWYVYLSAIGTVVALPVVTSPGPTAPAPAARDTPAGLASPAYTITDLGTLGGQDSQPFSLNNRSQIVGCADGKACLWENGQRRDLGTLGGDHSAAYHINDHGQVVGQADTRSGASHAFLWSGGTMRDLGTFGGKNSVAYDINNAGEVVGGAELPAKSRYAWLQRAFLYRDGMMRKIEVLSGKEHEARGINSHHQIVGRSVAEQTGGLMGHPFIWDRGKVRDLGGYGLWSAANAINDRGQVIGQITGIESSNATLWQNGQEIDLGIFNGALGINNRGEIVGFKGSDRAISGPPDRAVIWRDSAMLQLDDLIPPKSGWVLQRATAINDRGQIVGIGTKEEKRHAFLLTPKP